MRTLTVGSVCGLNTFYIKHDLNVQAEIPTAYKCNWPITRCLYRFILFFTFFT